MAPEKPEIWGMHLTLTCVRCGGEVPNYFSWDSVKAGVRGNPGDYLMDCLREAYTQHLGLNLCSINLKKKLEQAAGGPVEIREL